MKNKIKLKYVFIILLVCLVFITNATAQTLPPGSTSASEDKRLKKKAIDKRVPPEIIPDIKKTEIKEQDFPVEADKKFLVKTIIFSGNHIVSDKQIRKIVAPHENLQLNLKELIKIADEITQFYHTKGHIACQAYVPPQKIENNTVKIEILEGKIGDIHIEGNKYFSSDIFKRALNKLKGKILDYTKLLVELRYLNRNPDRDVKGVMVAGKKPGETDILIKVKDKFPMHFDYEVNNFGTKYTDRTRHGFTFRSNNFTGVDDMLLLNYRKSQQKDSYNGYLLSYNLPLPFAYNKRTKLNLLLSYSKTDLLREFKPLDTVGYAFNGYASFGQVLFDTLNLLCGYNFGFEIKRSSMKQSGKRLSFDKLSNARMDIVFEEYDRFGRTSLVNEFRQGFSNFLNSSASTNLLASRTGGDTDFFRYKASLSRINKFIGPTFILLGAEGQLASTKLLDYEQMTVGGVYTVRGYHEGEATGDDGISVITELRSPLFFVPDGIMPKKYKDLFQLAAFCDYAYIHLDDANNRSLTGVGSGLRFSMHEHAYGKIDVAWAVGDESSEGNSGPRVHFSYSVGF